jgi:hypothetical protein
MPVNAFDLHGLTFGLLTPVSFLGSDDQGGRWRCRCQCGGVVTKHTKVLLRNHGKTVHGYPLSCGCRQGNRARIRVEADEF